MTRNKATLLATLAGIFALAAACSATAPNGGPDPRTGQERERDNEPSGMKGGGGGGY